MGPLSYVLSVVERNVVMRHMRVRTINSLFFHEDVTTFQPQIITVKRFAQVPSLSIWMPYYGIITTFAQ
jgi:hypothetical protein